MKTIEIHGTLRDSRIIIGESIGNVGKYLPPGRAVIITDPNVYGYYHQLMPSREIIQIGTGENTKNLDTIHHILKELLGMEADRAVFILGIGGGIVCDISGFAASIYLRGVSFGFVSTTLLSQVDASVGGKNGVNFEGYKNMVGVFNQPDFVICDPHLLKTLPERELINGCAEIVKHAAISDRDLFTYLEEYYKAIFELKEDVIEHLVDRSIAIKSEIVNRDEVEKGERRKLNFGHTIGHAIEKVTGSPHGEAVSVGMGVAAKLSERKGLLSEEERVKIETLLANLKLPTDMPAERQMVLKAIARDKKREGGSINFVLLEGIGNAVIKEIPVDELEDALF
jgi:3-dehydroquinate synthase